MPRPPGLLQRVSRETPGAGTAVAGWQSHPPCSSPALGRAAPFLSAPRPAWLHQSRRRVTHVERGVRSVRRARRLGGCPLPQGPIPPASPPPTSSLPIARSPCKVGTKHSLPSALRKWSLESPGYRELCCPILRSLVGDLRAGKPDTHLTMEVVPEASVLPVPEMLKAWPSCSPRPRTPSGSPPPLLLLELHSSRRRHAGPRGSC